MARHRSVWQGSRSGKERGSQQTRSALIKIAEFAADPDGPQPAVVPLKLDRECVSRRRQFVGLDYGEVDVVGRDAT